MSPPDALAMVLFGFGAVGLVLIALAIATARYNDGLESASVDGRRMAETGTGSGRSPTSAVPSEETADAPIARTITPSEGTP
jgi:hypothetical protein